MPDFPEYLISIVAMDKWIKDSAPYGKKTEMKGRIASFLLGGTLDAYNDALRKRKNVRVSTKQAHELIELVNRIQRLVEPQKVLESWAPEPEKRTVARLEPRSADLGQIEVVGQASENLISAAVFPIASRYAALYVDKVRFFQKLKGGAPEIGNGEYLRIEVPSGLHGAVVLPVDHRSGDVLLVTQYRHAPQRFLTECPRGFGNAGADKDAIATARRELLAETGYVPIKTKEGVEELYLLKDSYTDTGKLTEKPSLFLALVNRDDYQQHLNHSNAAMEDPVWVRLPRFVEALFSRNAIAVTEGVDFDFLASPQPHLTRMRPETLISQGLLAIEDSFTLLAGLLALPVLTTRFPGTIPDRSR